MFCWPPTFMYYPTVILPNCSDSLNHTLTKSIFTKGKAVTTRAFVSSNHITAHCIDVTTDVVMVTLVDVIVTGLARLSRLTHTAPDTVTCDGTHSAPTNIITVLAPSG